MGLKVKIEISFVANLDNSFKKVNNKDADMSAQIMTFASWYAPLLFTIPLGQRPIPLYR